MAQSGPRKPRRSVAVQLGTGDEEEDDLKMILSPRGCAGRYTSWYPTPRGKAVSWRDTDQIISTLLLKEDPLWTHSVSSTVRNIPHPPKHNIENKQVGY